MPQINNFLRHLQYVLACQTDSCGLVVSKIKMSCAVTDVVNFEVMWAAVHKYQHV
jgi:hypothetical protein